MADCVKWHRGMDSSFAASRNFEVESGVDHLLWKFLGSSAVSLLQEESRF